MSEAAANNQYILWQKFQLGVILKTYVLAQQICIFLQPYLADLLSVDQDGCEASVKNYCMFKSFHIFSEIFEYSRLFLLLHVDATVCFGHLRHLSLLLRAILGLFFIL